MATSKPMLKGLAYWATERRRAAAAAYERRHPGFAQMTATEQLRIRVLDGLLADVPPPPDVLGLVVQRQGLNKEASCPRP